MLPVCSDKHKKSQGVRVSHRAYTQSDSQGGSTNMASMSPQYRVRADALLINHTGLESKKGLPQY